MSAMLASIQGMVEQAVLKTCHPLSIREAKVMRKELALCSTFFETWQGMSYHMHKQHTLDAGSCHVILGREYNDILGHLKRSQRV
jgi:hypothetical protein